MIDYQQIEKIVNEVIKRIEQLKNREKPKLLVISPHSESNQIEDLSEYWEVERLTPSMEIPKGFQHAVFLDVNQDLFVKGALGLTDTPESLLFSELMLKEFQVDFVPTESLNWIIESAEKERVNKNYKKHLLQYEKQLQDLGVRFKPITSILPLETEISPHSNLMGHFDEKVLTKQTIETWKEECIYIKPCTIITPLARDVAKEMGISIYIIDDKRG